MEEVKTFIIITADAEYYISAKNILQLYNKLQKLKSKFCIYDDEILKIDDSMPNLSKEHFVRFWKKEGMQSILFEESA